MKPEETATRLADGAPLGDSPGNRTLLDRLNYTFGPLIGAIILDLVDLATIGPIGLVLGFAIGCPVGWWISSAYGFSTRGRWVVALLAGLYCTIPFTEVFPLATIVAAVARYRMYPQKPDATPAP